MVRRVALVLVAVVVAGIGGALVLLYAGRADERALAALQPVDVLVAVQQVEAGTGLDEALSSGALEPARRPASSLPDGFLDPRAPEPGDVLLTRLYRGEVLLEQKVGTPEALENLSIPDGRMAASFTFGDPNRVADFVAPGSSVAVFLTADLTQAAAAPPDPLAQDDTAPTTRTTRLLLPEVQVIAVGGTTSSTTTVVDASGQQQTTEANLSLLTLSLTQQEAERLILAQDLGELYLGLLDAGTVIELGPGASRSSLFDAVTP